MTNYFFIILGPPRGKVIGFLWKLKAVEIIFVFSYRKLDISVRGSLWIKMGVDYTQI